ncbi:MAG TPA: signal peptidase I [Candidatus Limnocylindria bacterium]|jgi:signal peptidase I
MTYAPDATSEDGPRPEEASGRKGLGCLLEIVETLVLTLVIYLLIHNFIAQPFEVEQDSMFPTILEHEYVLIDKLSPRFSEYDRGDIVVFQPPEGFEQGGVPFIKRVIGLPGDRITLENGRVFVTPPDGSPVRLTEPYVVMVEGDRAPTLPRDAERTSEWTVPEGQYFVMGDNRPQSQDSRFFGPIERESIIGRAWLRYFPLDRIGLMERPVYAGLDGTDPEPTGWRRGPPAGIGYERGGSTATIQVSTSRS